MARARSVVGLGWLALDDRPGGTVPSGLAAEAALAAVTEGHAARVVGRVGQDRTGDELVAALREAGVDAGVLQRDPDLPTPERLVRADGTPSPRVDELPAAPDVLQWDFDLEDTARWADVVVFGLESWRSGQARSEELRFLDEAAAATRVADLVARTPSRRADASVPRAWLQSALERAQVARLDAEAISTADGRHHEDREGVLEAAAALARRHELVALVPLPAGDGGDGDGDGPETATTPPASAIAIVIDAAGERVELDEPVTEDDVPRWLVRAGVAALLDPTAAGIAGALRGPATA